MSETKLWDAVLAEIRAHLTPEEFRRWFGESMQASDSGDQVSVWIPSETVRRHIFTHYQVLIDRALERLEREDVQIRFVVTGVSDEEDEE